MKFIETVSCIAKKIIQAVNTKTNIKLCIQLSCVSKQWVQPSVVGAAAGSDPFSKPNNNYVDSMIENCHGACY